MDLCPRLVRCAWQQVQDRRGTRARRGRNFRILIGPDGQGRGLGTEATALVLRHAFTALRLHRVELSVYAFNPRAKRAYEKAGFRTEGVLRDALRLEDGQRVDAVVMAALAPQWLAGDHPRA